MRRFVRFLGIGSALFLGPLPAPSQVEPSAARSASTVLVVPLHPWALAALRRVATVAEEKLAKPGCQEVLRDFRDGAGRLLDDVLKEAGWKGEWLLRGIRFTDGTMSAPCADRQTLAWTHPGERTIRLCEPQFHEAAYRDARFTANMLIHEGLHGLGLGENPPSSLVITARVAERCGY